MAYLWKQKKKGQLKQLLSKNKGRVSMKRANFLGLHLELERWSPTRMKIAYLLQPMWKNDDAKLGFRN